MSTKGSITRCIRDLEDGVQREEAARDLWDRYFEELARYALKKLQAIHAVRSIADEEDAALRAFAKVCRGIERGQLKIRNRGDLWKLLLWSTKGEAINQVNHSGDRPGREVDSDEEEAGIQQVPDKEMTPEHSLLAEEGCRRLLGLLDEEPRLRQIALWKLLGHTNEEIKGKLGCSLATVERKIDRIRQRWAKVAPAGPVKPGPRNASGAALVEDIGRTTVILRGLAGRS